MFFRKLTDAELQQIRKAKEKANKAIKKQRRQIKEEMKRSTQYGEKLLQGDLDSHKLIKEWPVELRTYNGRILVNYSLLLKIGTSLRRSGFLEGYVGIENGDFTSLVIKYWNSHMDGQLEIYELPTYQRAVLKDLPVVDI